MALPTPKRIKGLLELMDEALDMDAAYEGVARLGLKADNTATDRAKALGFDVGNPVYHGTRKDIKSFDKRKSEFSKGGDNSEGYFVTDNPNTASMYAGRVNERYPKDFPNVLKLYTNQKNTFDYTNPKHINMLSEKLDKLPSDKFTRYGYPSSANEFMDDVVKGKWIAIEDGAVHTALKKTGFDSALVKENMQTNTQLFNNKNMKSVFAKFNPKYAGIGAGSTMSANLLAAPSGQPEFREAPMGFLDKAKKYAADSYEYAANEGGPVGKFLYSGGAEALKDIEQGTTPMVKTGRLPAMPTGAALANLLELLQL